MAGAKEPLGRTDAPIGVRSRSARLALFRSDQTGRDGWLRQGDPDQATFCYVSDVFVDPAQRGSGISKIMMAAVMAHPELQDLRLWVLATADAHGLYARHGFKPLAAPYRYMERRDAQVYQRMADAVARSAS